MQIWKWLLVIGLLFLVTYNPSTRTLADFFEPSRVVVDDGLLTGTAQSDSSPSDDDRESTAYVDRS